MSSDRDLCYQYRIGFTGVTEQTPSSKVPLKRDYLVDAAKQLHVAQERDANEEYEAAFSHYKHGVELLLSGITVDPSRERRDAVKRKISQYLKRAEEIFNCHLQRPLGNVTGAAEGYSSLRFRPIRVLSAAVENLKNWRVLEIIDKVQLVCDPSSGTKYILKSLMKSGRCGHGAITVIPQSVPYMVQLQKFYVGEDSLYLQLLHVPGGRLWEHLRKYQPQVTNSGDSTVTPKQVIKTQSPISHLSLSHDSVQGVPESQVRLWGAQLLLALDTLHQEGVLCKDLNPRNVLLGDKGNVLLTYFGQWREVDHVCCPEAVEQLYVAPEVLGAGAVDEACDWWSLGALLYEMMTGQVALTHCACGTLCPFVPRVMRVLHVAPHPTFRTMLQPLASPGLSRLKRPLGDAYRVTLAATPVARPRIVVLSCNSFTYPLYKTLISDVGSQMEIPFPKQLSEDAVSLLRALLTYDPEKRLGSSPGGAQRIKSHSFFSDIQWNKLL